MWPSSCYPFNFIFIMVIIKHVSLYGNLTDFYVISYLGIFAVFLKRNQCLHIFGVNNIYPCDGVVQGVHGYSKILNSICFRISFSNFYSNSYLRILNGYSVINGFKNRYHNIRPFNIQSIYPLYIIYYFNYFVFIILNFLLFCNHKIQLIQFLN